MTEVEEDRPENYVRWAIKVALGIVMAQGAWRERNDAIQEACLALSLAWERYDPALGGFQKLALSRVTGAVRRALAKQRKWRGVAR